MARLRDVPEWNIWRAMKRRCSSPKDISYANYGGRGIAVDKRWQDSFDNFYSDMGPRSSNEYSLDRIDNDKGYSPDNCKWSTKSEQAHNRRLRQDADYTGTIWDPRKNRWWARLRFHGQQISIGYFKDRGEANAAYISVASQLYDTL